jgi:hypothetical protein
MYSEAHVFDFSFVASDKKRGTSGELVFTIKKANLPRLIDRMHAIAQRFDLGKYLKGEILFALPGSDLLDSGLFGFEKCGYVTYEDDEVSFRLKLSSRGLHRITATILILTTALRVLFDQGENKGNRSQQVDISTICDPDRYGYNHAVYGYLSPQVFEWIKKEGERAEKTSWSVAPHKEITKAMQDAWKAVAGKEGARWARECYGQVMPDGRFILSCVGNACDLAIYHDQLPFDGIARESVDFGCHNLDTAAQQLTLLAGLAKLCELARKDEQ